MKKLVALIILSLATTAFAQQPPLLLAQPAACSATGLLTQCAKGCSAANSCRTNAANHYSRECMSGRITPDVAAQRVSLACDSCLKQNCR